MADSVSAREVFPENATNLRAAMQTPCRRHADFFILHGTLTDAKILAENIKVMARPDRGRDAHY
jgi:hypothetical protein